MTGWVKSNSRQPGPLRSASNGHLSDRSISLASNVRQLSGGSGPSGTADEWFETTNRNVRRGSGDCFDNDPPFYMKDQACVYPSMASHTRTTQQSSPHVLTRPALCSMPSNQPSSGGSNSDDFRSVIDDLTIENRSLKQKLRKYEKLHCAHLQSDKLFEVRVHALSPQKKRELQETLQDFASSLHDSPSPAVGSRTPFRRQPRMAPHESRKGSSTSTLQSQRVDSAYASMSASGLNSNTTLGRARDRLAPSAAGKDQKAKDQKVESYLQEIPAGLLPRHSLVMTESARQKLVVRRLEQLFTGKAPENVDSSQPLQQQEVSESAAHAERTAVESKGRSAGMEGHREARILPPDAEILPDADEEEPPTGTAGVTRPLSKSGFDKTEISTVSSGNGSPDQRPTRPLDLDPHRAQHALDNVEYLRHLGLSTPMLDDNATSEGSDGWIYLNLLVNMAQLHTINVTPDFIRKAVVDKSDKFDLSPDGRKIRWRGGREGTKLSSDSGSSPDARYRKSPRRVSTGTTTKDGEQLVCHARSPTLNMSTWQDTRATMPAASDSNMMSDSAQVGRHQVLAMPQHNDHSLQYKPIFYHTSASDDSDDEINATGDTAMASGVALGMTGACGKSPWNFNSHPEVQGSRTGRVEEHDGPIIFYDKARFCTDLSGQDPTKAPERFDFASYTRISHIPLGCRHDPMTRVDDGSPVAGFGDVYDHSMPKMYFELPSDDGDGDDAIESGSILAADLIIHSTAVASPNDKYLRPEIPNLEASGLSGVQPADNLAITVRTLYPLDGKTTNSPSAPNSGRGTPRLGARNGNDQPPNSRILPTGSRSERQHDCFEDKTEQHRASTVQSSSGPRIISVTRVSLQPSSLPPPSQIFLPFTSSEDGDDTSSESESSFGLGEASPRSYTRSAPHFVAPAIHGLCLASVPSVGGNSSGGADSDVDSDVDSDSDSSIDLLAAARKFDPVSIAEQEREFDRSLGLQFDLQELPAGSSAATAGGGSGFSSEDDDLPDTWQSTAYQQRLKRERSMSDASEASYSRSKMLRR
ncbi:MAG: hypothetical protein M1817_004246 [Caeruleum heppii]|nr:MAG: hypothetical protein M1817_004246 [Caeruleum heppii]